MLHNKYFEIMKEFLKGYSEKIYGRGLIEKVSLSQKNIALTLKELEKEGILKSSDSGNRKYYELNKLNPLLAENLLLFENMKRLEFLNKNNKFIDFFREVRGEILCVFGSYAKGRETKDSDLDLFLVGKADSLEIKKSAKKYGLNVQIFNLSFKDFSKMAKNKKEFFKEIMENHILIRGEELFLGEVAKWWA